MTKQSGIYAIRHIESGKLYLGSAINIRNRWKEHRKDLKRARHHCQHLQNAWRKHGPDSFVFEILELVADKANLIAREQSWIDQTPRRTRYNTSPTAGSPLGTKHTPETRAKHSHKSNARWADPAYRANVTAAMSTAEYYAKQSAASLSQWQTPGMRARRSAIIKLLWADPEYRAKMFAAKKARWTDPEYRAKQSAARRANWADPANRAKRLASTKRGAANKNAKLTDDDVREIRSLAATGCTHKQISRIKGVSRPTIDRILLRKRYAHLA